jgi:hypothetical protein
MTFFLSGKLELALPTLYEKILIIKGESTMGKKHRNRINSPKKNNHIPPEAIVAEQEAHGKEY